MDCSQVRQIILEYPEIDVPEELRRSVEAHLSACPSCARRLATLREQLRALQALPEVKAPDDFLECVLRKIDDPSASKASDGKKGALRGSWLFPRWAGVAAVLLLVVAAYHAAQREGCKDMGLAPPAPVVGMSRPASPALESAAQDEASPKETILSAAPKASAPSVEGEQITLFVAPRPQKEAVGAKARGPSADAEGGAARRLRERAEPFAESEQRAKGSAAQKEKKLESVAPDAAGLERDRVLYEIRQAVLRLNGRVLSFQEGAGGERAELHAEAPAEAYGALLEELKRLGEVKTSGSEPPAHGGGIRLRIEILPPK